MWLYLPSTCCPSAPASECSTKPSDWLCRELARSAVSSTKSMPARYWQRAWPKVALTTPPFSRILPPSTAARGVERWICSLRDSRASRTPWPDSEKGRPMTDGSGRTSPESSGKSSRGTSSLKTFEDSSPIARLEKGSWRTNQMNLAGEWAPYSDRWPNSGSMRSGRCWERTKLAPATKGSGSLSWPTPDSMSGGPESATRKKELGRLDLGGGDLSAAAAAWQTPAVDSFRSTGLDRKDETGLDQPARNWPTPASRDYRTPNLQTYEERGGESKGEQLQNFVDQWMAGASSLQVQDWVRIACSMTFETFSEASLDELGNAIRPNLPTPSAGAKSLDEAPGSPQPLTKLRLNPFFVAWTMGWPAFWCATAPMPFAPQATELYRSALRRRLRCLLGNLIGVHLWNLWTVFSGEGLKGAYE